MTPHQIREAKVEAYKKQIGSKSTYLYEVYTSEYKTNSFFVVLADSDDEAKHIVSLLEIKAVWMRMDHWGYGPRIELKGVSK